MNETDASVLHRFLFPGTDTDIAAAYEHLAEAASGVSWGLEDEVAYLDVETTGFDPERDAIIEVALLIARGPEVLERYSSLVDPGREIPIEATQLTGIDAAAVAGAPSIAQVVGEVADLLGGRDIVAHNAAFDAAFILAAAGRAGRSIPGRWIDSLQLARIGLPRMRSHRLRDLAEAFGRPLSTHRAAADVESLFAITRVALAGLGELPVEVLEHIAALSPQTEWSARDVLRQIAARGRDRTFDLKRLRADRVRGKRAPGLADADGREVVCPEPDEVLAEFDEHGAVGRMYAGFESRDEQLRMAEAVLEAFASRTHVAVEAGTGVGKSVAYLVPAALFATRNALGVGVATKSNTLMDQLVYGELPALQRALGGKLRYAALKGYEHYLCLRKVDRALATPDELPVDELANLAAVLAWAAQSSWGDVHAINVHWGPMRSRLTCSVEDCTRKRCRFYPDLCYLHGVRRVASSAHIVVTNHALLFRDSAAAGGILPQLRYWVIDEAHAAESEARRQLSVTADHRTIAGLLAALHSGRGGAVDAARTKGRATAARSGDDELVARIERAATTMRSEVASATTIAASFFDFLKDLAPSDADYETSELRVTSEMRETAAFSTAAGVGNSLARRLESVVRSGKDLVVGLEETGDDTVEVRADLAGLLSRLAEQLAGLEAVLDGSDESFVYSVKVSRRREDMRDRMGAALLDVGATLVERFYPEVHSVVFTSATIATGDDFGHLARTVGLDRLGEDSYRTLRLESSFDFERQMAVFVPTDLPEASLARDPSVLAGFLEQLHTAMGGSVLTLFTNQREMERVYDLVVEPLAEKGLRVLLQGRGVSTKRVRDEFIADERVSLFATRSFWEGFDAPGDTLRCVVIAKLPFGRVTDPLYEERRDRMGRRAWNDFYLPEAVLELKQAAGRLIRSASDEGCVVIADGRLAGEKGYVRTFLDALPVDDVEMLPRDAVIESVRKRFGR